MTSEEKLNEIIRVIDFVDTKVKAERQRIKKGIDKLESLTDPCTGDMNYETEHKGEWINKSEVLALLDNPTPQTNSLVDSKTLQGYRVKDYSLKRRSENKTGESRKGEEKR